MQHRRVLLTECDGEQPARREGLLRAFRMHKVHGETPPNGEIGVFPVFWFTAVLKGFLLKSSSRGAVMSVTKQR